MKVLFLANSDWYLYGYRLDLIRAAKYEGFQTILVSPDGEYSELLKKEGLEWEEIRLSRRSLNPFRELISLFRLVAFYRKNQVDVVHHFTVKPVIYGSIAAKLSKVPKIINSITGLGYFFVSQSPLSLLFRPLLRFLYRISLKGTRVIFQNRENADYFVDAGIVTRDQLVLIPGSGVDVNRFHPTSEPAGIPKVILPGRLIREKGVVEFVEAAKQINLAGKIADFVLIGSSDQDNLSPISENELRTWQKEGQIEWMGWQSDMPSVYRNMNILCLPTYGEGLPKVLLEAAASARAIVATDVPGCRDIVIDGETGLLVPARNVDALKKAILALVNDPDLRKQMGARGRRLVIEHFSLEEVNRRTLTLYS